MVIVAMMIVVWALSANKNSSPTEPKNDRPVERWYS
jgi:hypothetical protein